LYAIDQMGENAGPSGDFIVVNSDDSRTEFTTSDGKIIVKQFSGIGTENFIIKKYNGKSISFSFFKLNGIYYVNVNGVHVMDYHKFIHIISMHQTETGVTIKNGYVGEMYIDNCDMSIMHKALETMAKWSAQKRSIWRDIVYYIFN